MTVGKTIGIKKGHCERTSGERGNLLNGTQKGQIASTKRPRNDGGEFAMTKATVIASGPQGSVAIS